MPERHRQFFDGLQLYHRKEHCLCSHAGLNPSEDIERQTARDFVWGHAAFPDRYTGQEAIVYGHDACKGTDEQGHPQLRLRGRTYGIDTISQGVLTALRLPDLQVWRSKRTPPRSDRET